MDGCPSFFAFKKSKNLEKGVWHLWHRVASLIISKIGRISVVAHVWHHVASHCYIDDCCGMSVAFSIQIQEM